MKTVELVLGMSLHLSSTVREPATFRLRLVGVHSQEEGALGQAG